MTTTVPPRLTPDTRALTAAQLQGLADVPPELGWFANIQNPRTRAAYKLDIQHFMRFTGIDHPEESRRITRAHVIAWRDEFTRRALSPATIRRKLPALSSLYQSLCEKSAVFLNPVQGLQRPKANNKEGAKPALSDEQARAPLRVAPHQTVERVEL
jgi:site-specific recombinase XerD